MCVCVCVGVCVCVCVCVCVWVCVGGWVGVGACVLVCSHSVSSLLCSSEHAVVPYLKANVRNKYVRIRM